MSTIERERKKERARERGNGSVNFVLSNGVVFELVQETASPYIQTDCFISGPRAYEQCPQFRALSPLKQQAACTLHEMLVCRENLDSVRFSHSRIDMATKQDYWMTGRNLWASACQLKAVAITWSIIWPTLCYNPRTSVEQYHQLFTILLIKILRAKDGWVP